MKTWKNSFDISDCLIKAIFTVASVMMLSLTFARQQGQTIGVNSNNEAKSSPMTAAFVWIIGLAVFVILLFSILRPKKRI